MTDRMDVAPRADARNPMAYGLTLRVGGMAGSGGHRVEPSNNLGSKNPYEPSAPGARKYPGLNFCDGWSAFLTAVFIDVIVTLWTR
jgi:hypothetical protein